LFHLLVPGGKWETFALADANAVVAAVDRDDINTALRLSWCPENIGA
jgi:hypothetical protein